MTTIFTSGQILYANALNDNFAERAYANNANLTGTVAVTGNINVSGVASLNTISLSRLSVGNSTVNAVVNSTSVALANSSISLNIILPSSNAQGANNYFLHANGSWVEVPAQTGNTTNTQLLFNSSNSLAGSNNLVYNGSVLSTNAVSLTGTLKIGNSSVNVTVNSTSFSGTANNASFAYGASQSDLNVNSASYANNTTYAFGKTESNLNVNTALVANNANYLGGASASDFANLTQVVAYANQAYSNAILFANGLILDSVNSNSVTRAASANAVGAAYSLAYDANSRAFSAQTQAAQAYTNAATLATAAFNNATAFAANATNISSGTLPNARLAPQVVNTSGAFTFTGAHVYNANITINNALVASGNSGANGLYLTSNGTNIFWAATPVASFSNGIQITVSGINVNGALTANGSTGGTGYVLSSNGSSTFWKLENAAGAVDTAFAYTFTNTVSFSNTISFGNSSVNTTVNGTSFSGTANNALYLGGALANTFQPKSSMSAYALLAGATFAGDITAQNANTILDMNVGRNLLVAGNMTVSGNVTVIGANNLSVVDNMIYLNSNSNVTNPDIGFAGNYNDGTYRHTGFFRDATDGVWKVFDSYEPEPDASPYINTANATFKIANFQANQLFVGNTSVYSTINTTSFNGTANNALYLGGSLAAGFVQNTESRTLSGNLYFTGSNTTFLSRVTIANSSGNTVVFASNGNVGIGNSSPIHPLRVEGVISDRIGDLRTIPINNQTSNYTTLPADVGKVISITTGGVVVNGAIHTAGDTLSVYNNSSSDQTIAPGSGTTIYLAGTANTSTRTIAQRGVATLLCVAANTFVISGSGLV